MSGTIFWPELDFALHTMASLETYMKCGEHVLARIGPCLYTQREARIRILRNVGDIFWTKLDFAFTLKGGPGNAFEMLGTMLARIRLCL